MQMRYHPDRAVDCYRALEAVLGMEATTADGQKRIVRQFERALLKEAGALIIVDLPQGLLDEAAEYLKEDA